MTLNTDIKSENLRAECETECEAAWAIWVPLYPEPGNRGGHCYTLFCLTSNTKLQMSALSCVYGYVCVLYTDAHNRVWNVHNSTVHCLHVSVCNRALVFQSVFQISSENEEALCVIEHSCSPNLMVRGHLRPLLLQQGAENWSRKIAHTQFFQT